MKSGVCKLTLRRGKFIRAHIIPKALTKPNVRGNQFVQFGMGLEPKQMWSSWCDDELVICDGEDILARYDAWAITELRRLKLVWASWGSAKALPTQEPFAFKHPEFGLRKFECRNSDRLRLFFLSLLWRAAASTRPEFECVELSAGHLEQLRSMVHDGNPRPLSFYPVTLVQIVTRGHTHNFVPLAQDNVVDIGEGRQYRHYTFRFYFDGLIAHMHRGEMREIGDLAVGNSRTLIVQTRSFKNSWQQVNLSKGWAESVIQWPKKFQRLTGNTPSWSEAVEKEYLARYGSLPRPRKNTEPGPKIE